MTRSELADAMLKGATSQGVIEADDDYLGLREREGKEFCKACALGCALIGRHDGDYQEAEASFKRIYAGQRDKDFSNFPGLFAQLLQIPSALAEEVERMHLRGRAVVEIAAWLKEKE